MAAPRQRRDRHVRAGPEPGRVLAWRRRQGGLHLLRHPGGPARGVWNALTIAGGDLRLPRYIADAKEDTPLGKLKGRAVLVRVTGMDARNNTGFNEAMDALEMLARRLFRSGSLDKAEEFRFYLSGSLIRTRGERLVVEHRLEVRLASQTPARLEGHRNSQKSVSRRLLVSRVTGLIRHSTASTSRSCWVMRSSIRADGRIWGFGGCRIASWRALAQEGNAGPESLAGTA